jgi:hypothetical protein
VKRRKANLLVLAPIVPFVGFLPSPLQAFFHERYGIHPRTATAFSLGVEWAAIVALGGMLLIHMFTQIFNTAYLLASIMILAVDSWVRKDSLLREAMDPPGFFEWLFRLRLW